MNDTLIAFGILALTASAGFALIATLGTARRRNARARKVHAMRPEVGDTILMLEDIDELYIFAGETGVIRAVMFNDDTEYRIEMNGATKANGVPRRLTLDQNELWMLKLVR